MDRLFTIIEQTFGALTVRIAVVLFVLYFLGEGFSKLLLSVRDVSSKRRRLEHEKSMLEILKLRCDIEALKKVHGLDHIELPELKLSFAQPSAKKPLVPLANSLAKYLTAQGRFGKVLLVILSFVFQLICIVATFILVIGVAAISEGRTRKDIGTFMAVVMAVAAITGYLGYYLLSRPLDRNLRSNIIGATVVVLVGGLALIGMFVDASK